MFLPTQSYTRRCLSAHPSASAPPSPRSTLDPPPVAPPPRNPCHCPPDHPCQCNQSHAPGRARRSAASPVACDRARNTYSLARPLRPHWLRLIGSHALTHSPHPLRPGMLWSSSHESLTSLVLLEGPPLPAPGYLPYSALVLTSCCSLEADAPWGIKG